MMLSPLRIAAAAALVGGALATSISPAGAGISTGLLTAPTFNRDAPEFTFEADGAEPTCDSPAVTVTGVDGELDAEAVLAFDTPLSGTFTPGDAPAGYYELSIECQNGEFPETFTGGFAFARLTVEKVLEGEAPADATFVILSDCQGEDSDDSFAQELEFPAAGGVQDVIVYGPTTCTTSETDDGGADSSAVENPETDFVPEPVDLATTVTNVFEASPPTPTPTPEPPAALPVAVAPTFTG